jgi:hypothetical protein
MGPNANIVAHRTVEGSSIFLFMQFFLQGLSRAISCREQMQDRVAGGEGEEMQEARRTRRWRPPFPWPERPLVGRQRGV